MPIIKVPHRLSRDFGIRPSEGAIRFWIRTYNRQPSQWESYESLVLSSFSGILCLDELYQGHLAVLLAVDPASPKGDRLIAYQLTRKDALDSGEVEHFLETLRKKGLKPQEVITDASSLYPEPIKKIWPHTAQQLCLFHKTQAMVRAASSAIDELKRSLPKKTPKKGHLNSFGRPLFCKTIFRLRKQGLSIREIARQTDRSRNTVTKWLRLGLDGNGKLSGDDLFRTILELQKDGISIRKIAQKTRRDRKMISNYLKLSQPISLLDSKEEISQNLGMPGIKPSNVPPPPWASWDEVRTIKGYLRAAKYLLTRQPGKIRDQDAAKLQYLLRSPIGDDIKTIREFACRWYDIWLNEESKRRTSSEAKLRWLQLSQWEDCQRFRSLVRFQSQMTPVLFGSLSNFLNDSTFEATSNGAERVCRTIRHFQKAHYNFRSEQILAKYIEEHTIRIHCNTSKACFSYSTKGRKTNQKQKAA
jgi:lambda repressor-like predicted transcriptional regulator